ncbi:hypothetical protein A4D02_12540 [Niastella koreensis]|nr:hypothetical protein A4D02_12540 [Niastella koreensis]
MYFKTPNQKGAFLMKRFKRFVLNKRKGWLMGIAIYQLLGAIVLLILMVTILSAQPEISGGVIFAVIPMIALSLVSIMAGIFYFIKGKELKFYTLSKLNLCAQLLQLTIPPGFTFIYYYGPYFALGINGHTLAIRFETLTANFNFSIGGQEEGLVVLFNCVPLLILIILRWIERNKTAPTGFDNSFVDGPRQEATPQEV